MNDNKRRILWVDNDPQYTQVYVLVLRDAGYEVIVETTVGAAKQRIDAGSRIDLALLDIAE